MRYDVILWDVDGTLLDFAYSQHHSLWECLKENGITPTEEILTRYSEINDSWWKRLEKGEVRKEELLTGRFYELFGEFGIENVDVDAFWKQYEGKLGTVYRYLDNSLEICKSLQGKCRQCVVTNGTTSVATSKLKLSGFYDVMDDIFISEQIGVPKPHRFFFERVLETMPKVPPDRMIIVGDSLSSDMLGGNNAGIATCWYNPANVVNTTEVHTDYIIRNLTEIFKILEG